MRVAFLGLGIMGSRMAPNLARAGFRLTRETLSAAAGRGCGEQDFVALIEALEGAAATRL